MSADNSVKYVFAHGGFIAKGRALSLEHLIEEARKLHTKTGERYYVLEVSRVLVVDDRGMTEYQD